MKESLRKEICMALENFINNDDVIEGIWERGKLVKRTNQPKEEVKSNKNSDNQQEDVKNLDMALPEKLETSEINEKVQEDHKNNSDSKEDNDRKEESEEYNDPEGI